MKSKLLLLVAVALCSLGSSAAMAQSYAITNARIVTVSGPTIERGTVIIRNGLIDAVGANLRAPSDAYVFDATGLTVYPGFIDGLTNWGIPARPAAAGGGPGGGGGAGGILAAQAAAAAAALASNSNYPSGLRPEDSAYEDLRAGEAQFETARTAGFTTALTTNRTGIFNGQSVVINLAGNSVSAMTVKVPAAHHVSFVTLGQFQFPASTLGTFAALRQMYYDAERLQEHQKLYATDPKGTRRPETDRSLEALFPVVNRTMPVVFNANTENQIVRALDLIRELNIRGIIAGGQEAWKVADRLKAQNVPVLLSMNFPRRTASASPDADPESMETLRMRAETPKAAARLIAAGVKVGFQSGSGSTADFFANVQRSIEGGLSRDAAIRAMTLGTADILGVDDRLGSIEAGKIANLTLVRGDVFGRDKFVPQVVIDGKVFEHREPARPAGGRGPGTGGAAPGAGTPQNVAGTYSITIDIPSQPTQATLNFAQQGATLSGTMVSPGGTSQIRDGRVNTQGFSFTSTTQFQGSSIELNVMGSVSGNAITGSISTSLGSFPFNGTKNP